MNFISAPWSGFEKYAGAPTRYLPSSALAFTRVALGSWCLIFSAIAALALITPVGTADGVPRVLVACACISAVMVGLSWLLGTWPKNRISLCFVLYADAAVAVVFLNMNEPIVLFPGVALLTVIGSYVPAFHGIKVFIAHQCFSFSLTGLLFAQILAAPYTSLAVAFIYLLAALLLQVTVPVLTQGLFVMLCHEATRAHFDPLTGLRNRRGLLAELDRCYNEVRFSDGAEFVVLVLDLDKFKEVNDRYGHHHGDHVLEAVGHKIDTSFGENSISCRSGGEEFVLVSRNRQFTTVQTVRGLSSSVLAEVGVSVSVGVATHTCTPECAHGTDFGPVFTQLFRDADAAMYKAKALGGNTVVVHPHPSDG
ncbi:MAG: GGDEF domain-containing protein [Rhodococcus sp. (in: high G+C Gram-positive bacteria)]